MNDWGKYGRTYENIARNLAELSDIGRVICFLPPQQIEQGCYAWPFTFKRVSAKLFLITPNTRMVPTLTAPYRMRQWINRVLPDFLLNKFMRFLGFNMRNTVLWVFPPHYYIDKLVKSFPHSLLITQIIDNNTFLGNKDNQTITNIKNQYEDLSKKSDLIITSARINYDIFSKINNSCYFFENAVDPIFINSPTILPYRLNRRRPRLGYVGFITKRTDIKLLDYIARSRPEYDLLIAGPRQNLQQNNLNRYGTLDLPNVSYEGVIHYRDVPKFLQTIDVCLIPHKDTLYSKSMNPLNLYQYLGSGRPIVSTSIAGVERWNGLISIAVNYKDFVIKIDDALKNDNEDRSCRRISAAKNETWDKRIDEIFEVVMLHWKKRINQYANL